MLPYSYGSSHLRKYCKFFLAFLLCCALSLTVRAQFNQVFVESDMENEVLNASFYTANDGYVAFTKWLGVTHDGGKTFIKKPIEYGNVDWGSNPVSLTFGFGFKGVRAFDANNIIVFGEFGGVPSILTSANGGNTFKLVFWSKIGTFDFNDGILDMTFPGNGAVGYAVDPDRVLKTTNKGQTWSVVMQSKGSKFQKVKSTGVNNNIFIHSATKLYKSANGGSSWIQLSIPAGTIRCADFLNPNEGWINIGSETNSIYYSSDAGDTWTIKLNPSIASFHFNDLKFVDSKTGYAAGFANVYKTTDSGKIWEKLSNVGPAFSEPYSYSVINNLGASMWWAGGYKILASSSNAGGQPIPGAYFLIDTNGVASTKNVQLKNYSNPTYTFKWLRNGQLLSTSYNANFSPTPLKYRDTIQLVATNGALAGDTTTQYVSFSPVAIYSISPLSAAEGTTVIIKGINLGATNYVSFGGRRATDWRVVSSTEIHAIVGTGLSGAVMVNTEFGVAYFDGFRFIDPPILTLNHSVNDSILCKSEPVRLRIDNAEAEVEYTLMDSLEEKYGTVVGNGVTALLISKPLYRTGRYYVMVKKPGIAQTSMLKKTLWIEVEKTTSRFGQNLINVGVGEPVNYFQQSTDAATFQWIFHDDVNIGSSTSHNPTGIVYASPGIKTATLISTSLNGCTDTVLSNGVTVYNKALLKDECYVHDLTGMNVYEPGVESAGSYAIKQLPGNSYVISGSGIHPTISTRGGSGKYFNRDLVSYLARYSSEGVLQWQCHLGPEGSITGVETDDAGNIYVIGQLWIHDFLYFNNGDSMRIGRTDEKLVNFYQRKNGFILKLSAEGKYLWHTNFYDHNNEGLGFSVNEVIPTRIRVRNGKIFIGGNFASNFSYARNGVKQSLITLPRDWQENNRFFVRLSSEGEMNWYMYWEHADSQSDVLGVDIDKDDNLFILGRIGSYLTTHDVGKNTTIQFDPAVTGSSLLKFSPAGNLLWKINMEGYATAMVSDPLGNIILSHTIPFQQDRTRYNLTTADGQSHLMEHETSLLKFNAAGTLTAHSGVKPGRIESSDHLLALSGDQIYFFYRMRNNWDSEAPAVYEWKSANGKKIMHSAFSHDLILTKWSLSGNLEKVYNTALNSEGSFSPVSMFVNISGDLMFSGTTGKGYGGTVNFSFFDQPIHTNGYDGFLAKIKADGCASVSTPQADAGEDVFSCEQQALTIGKPAGNATYAWSSFPEGFLSAESNPSVFADTTTTYYLYVTGSSGIVTMDSVVVTVKAGPNVEAGADRTICTGDPVKIGMNAEAGVSYTWTSLPAGFSSSEASVTVSPSVTTSYILEAKAAGGCSLKDTVLIRTNGSVPFSLNVQAPTVFCRGVEAVFTARTTNGGDSVVYRWKINNVEVGTNAAIFKSRDLKTGDKVEVSATSSLSCASPKTINSNQWFVALKDVVIPDASIAISSANKCVGSPVSFTATVSNLSTNLTYQWVLNGVKTGSPIRNFLVSEPRVNDKIYVIVSTTDPCAGLVSDTSNVITLSGTAVTPSISLPPVVNVVTGQSAVVVASVLNASANATYQWEDSTDSQGWKKIGGATGKAITYSPQKSTDKIRCVLSTDDECSSQKKTTSNATTFLLTNVTAVDPDPMGEFGISVFPNPVSTALYMRNLRLADQWQLLTITDITGKQKLITIDARGKTSMEVPVGRLSSGVYLVRLIGKSGKTVYCKVVKR